ncbi:MAG: hypothetical protein Fur0025_02060 [Oscillatoriaceae cyanobacterium]
MGVIFMARESSKNKYSSHRLDANKGTEILPHHPRPKHHNDLSISEDNGIDKQLCRSIKFALDKTAIVAMTDAKGKIIYVNDKFCELSQYSEKELIGKDHRIVNSGYHSRQFFQVFWATIKSGQIWRGEIKNKAKDGSYYWVDTTVVPFLDEHGQPYQYLSIRFDITARKQAEAALKEAEEVSRQQAEMLQRALTELQQTQAQLVHTEKMSGLGQLVAGIAHEINNPINFIYGNLLYTAEYVEKILKLLGMYQYHYPEPVTEIQDATEALELDFLMEDLPKMVDSMQMGANRIRDLVRSLRNFSRLDESERKAVDIHPGIDSTLLILQHRLKRKGDNQEIELTQDYGNLPPVLCYPSQLNQVFMNILANAIDALEEQPSPSLITIRTRLVQGKEGDVAQITIADNGPGIPAAIHSRLFDPFFTTKPVGKGTGLGLSIAHQIVVEKHGGTLVCISPPGGGTEFIISIPLSRR